MLASFLCKRYRVLQKGKYCDTYWKASTIRTTITNNFHNLLGPTLFSFLDLYEVLTLYVLYYSNALFIILIITTCTAYVLRPRCRTKLIDAVCYSSSFLKRIPNISSLKLWLLVWRDREKFSCHKHSCGSCLSRMIRFYDGF